MSTQSPVSTSPQSSSNVQGEKILVLDFGSQTAQLIARRVREQNVFCQMVRHDLSADRIREIAPKALILSGGPASVYEKGSPHPDPRIFDLGIPILGICYGMQATCHALGSKVQPGESREFGHKTCHSHTTDPFFADVPTDSTVWMSHGDQVQDLDRDFISLASTDTCPHAAIDRPCGKAMCMRPCSMKCKSAPHGCWRNGKLSVFATA